MRFLDENREYFKTYDSTGELLEDIFFIVEDPFISLISFAKHFVGFLFFSFPVAAALISFNLPLLVLMLSFPYLLPYLTLNIPIIIAIAIFVVPAAVELGQALYHLVDFVLSPIVDTLRLISNIAASIAEPISEFDLSM